MWRNNCKRRIHSDKFLLSIFLNRVLIQPRKLPHGLTVRIGFDPNADEADKQEDFRTAMKQRVEFKLVFFVDDEAEKSVPGDEGWPLLLLAEDISQQAY